jgi:hypothetical protein
VTVVLAARWLLERQQHGGTRHEDRTDLGSSMGLSVMQWRRWLLCGVDGVYGLDRRQGRIGPGLLRVAAGWALRKERRRCEKATPMVAAIEDWAR